MGKTEKGIKCSVFSCNNKAVRSISTGKVETIGFRVESQKRAYLCDTHYRDFKKKSRSVKRVEQWRWQL